tara:strand:+ start:334 stop:720 length:387 start_codon:yes stop_codon:yes gene_type:complete
MTNLPNELEGIVLSLNRLKHDIEQLQKDNKKLNDDILILEKSRDEAYKSFNTKTHILISRDSLDDIRENLLEAKSSASYAYDEAGTAQSCAEEAKSSAEGAEDYARYGLDKIDEIIQEADKEKGDSNE